MQIKWIIVLTLLVFGRVDAYQSTVTLGPGVSTYTAISLKPGSCLDSNFQNALKMMYQVLMVPGYQDRMKGRIGRFSTCLKSLAKEARTVTLTSGKAHKIHQELRALNKAFLGSKQRDPDMLESGIGLIIASLADYLADKTPQTPNVRKTYMVTIENDAGLLLRKVYLPESIALLQLMFTVDTSKQTLTLKTPAQLKYAYRVWSETLPERTKQSLEAIRHSEKFYTPSQALIKVINQAEQGVRSRPRPQHKSTSALAEADELDVDADQTEDEEAELNEEEISEDDDADQALTKPSSGQTQANDAITSTEPAAKPNQPSFNWVFPSIPKLVAKKDEKGKLALTSQQNQNLKQVYTGLVKSVCKPLYSQMSHICTQYLKKRIIDHPYYSDKTIHFLVTPLTKARPKKISTAPRVDFIKEPKKKRNYVPFKQVIEEYKPPARKKNSPAPRYNRPLQRPAPVAVYNPEPVRPAPVAYKEEPDAEAQYGNEWGGEESEEDDEEGQY